MFCMLKVDVHVRPLNETLYLSLPVNSLWVLVPLYMVLLNVGVISGPRCQYKFRFPPQNSLFGLQVKCTLLPSKARVSTGWVWKSVAWPDPQINVIMRMSRNIVAVDTCRMSDEITANCSLYIDMKTRDTFDSLVNFKLICMKDGQLNKDLIRK